MSPTPHSVKPVSEREIEQYDHEVDVVIVGYGCAGAAVFTLGGLSTDLDARVEDLDGVAIPGLFAAGRASSGLHGFGYISGTSLGDGTFFGRRAGRAAAAEDRAE